MKRKLLITAVSVLLSVIFLPLNICAEQDNYIDSVWQKGYAGGITLKTDESEEYYCATGITGTWCSPTIEILPALKTLLLTRNSITVKISCDIRVKSETESGTATVRPIVRATDKMTTLADNDWNTAYRSACGTEKTYFSKSSGNVIWYFDAERTIEYNTWYHYENTFTVTRQIVNNTMTSDWIFCFDKISPVSDITSLDVKNAEIMFERLKGDVNCDGKVSSADRITLSRNLLGYEVGIDEKSADVNNDGKVNAVDRIILSRYLAGWQGYENYFM